MVHDPLSPTDVAGSASAPAPRAGRGLWITVIVFSVVVAAMGYLVTGRPDALTGQAQKAAIAADGSPPSPEQIEAMVQRLADRLKDMPDDVQGWQMLVRSYMILERYAEAAEASARVLRLQPDDPNALADHADTLALRNGRSLEGEPLTLIERALRIDPRNLKALALAGAAAFDRGDAAEAARLWERVVEVGPPDSPIVEQAREGVAEARRMAALAGAAATAPGPAHVQARIRGTVTLAPSLKDQTGPMETVFVVARSADADGAGGRMPLAVMRRQVKDLPFEFMLDDSQAMGPGMGLSTARRVVVTARVSRSGQAMPQAGDLEGSSSPVDVGTQGIRIEISRVVR